MDAIADELLDDLAALPHAADLHESVALPLPILVICELLGVPYEDRDAFRGWSEAAANVRDRARSEQGLAELFGYGLQLVTRKRRQPDDDVISRLCATDGVPDEEVAALSMALLFAGHETTVVQIGFGALTLLSTPGQWQALRAEPGRIPRAVEEILRVPAKGGNGVPRYARADIEVDGVQIRAGELVLLDTGAANHDPNVFTDPDRFDPGRRGAAHLSFGHGPRYCIGAPLARLELHSVFSRLIPRFPGMRPAVPLGNLTVRRDVLTGGLTALPVVW